MLNSFFHALGYTPNRMFLPFLPRKLVIVHAPFAIIRMQFKTFWSTDYSVIRVSYGEQPITTNAVGYAVACKVGTGYGVAYCIGGDVHALCGSHTGHTGPV